jgi:adenylate kinase
MIIALSGTPGTGKSSVSVILQQKGYTVLSLNEIAFQNNFILGVDKQRGSKILDINKINNFIKNKYTREDLVLIQGHASHLLKRVDKLIILRCHPKVLKNRLEKKEWNKEKIKENVEAEILDIILCDATELHPEKSIFEIDTTNISVNSVVSSILEIVNNQFQPIKKYKIGHIDWSEEILKEI